MLPITTVNTSSGPARWRELLSLASSGTRASRGPPAAGFHRQISRIVARNSTVMMAPGSTPATYSRAAEVLVIEP
ncbi:hypothetical protein D3C72_1205570 [compost metagenome]